VAVGGIDVTIPELLGETEAGGEIEDDVGIRAGFAGRRHDRRDCRSGLWQTAHTGPAPPIPPVLSGRDQASPTP
jgi:hypothetical protein